MGHHCPHQMWTCSSFLNSVSRSGLCSAAALFPVSAASGLLSPGSSDVNQPLEGYTATIKPAGLAFESAVKTCEGNTVRDKGTIDQLCFQNKSGQRTFQPALASKCDHYVWSNWHLSVTNLFAFCTWHCSVALAADSGISWPLAVCISGAVGCVIFCAV